MILRLVDGTTTVNLVGGPIYRAEYAPKSPDLSTVEFEPVTMADGGQVSAITRRNISEQCRVIVADSTTDAARATLQGIESMFLKAIEFNARKGGARVYVEFAAENDDTVYRSEILHGRTELGKDTLSWLPCADAMEVVLTWKRRYYWEASAETELELDNSHGTGTGGVTVYNHYDAANDNFVDIDSADVTGVLPAPVRLEMENTYGVSTRLYDLFIGHNVYSDPATLDHILEAEDAITPAGAGSNDANDSNGKYKGTNALSSTLAVVMAWTLDATVLGHLNGRYFRLLMRLHSANVSNSVYLTPKVTFPAATPLTVVAEGTEVKLNTAYALQDLGVIQLPPWLMGVDATLTAVDLTIYGRDPVNTPTLYVDFVQMTPLDSYRVLRPRGYGAAHKVRVVDDGMTGDLWTDGWSGVQRTGHYYGIGQPVHLIPGKDQRIYFLHTDSAGNAPTARTLEVRAYYRPRITTV